jgi:hypothetical protein
MLSVPFFLALTVIFDAQEKVQVPPKKIANNPLVKKHSYETSPFLIGKSSINI